MVEASKMRMVEKVPGENGEICVFETVAGVKFSVTKPVLSRGQKAALIDALREILEEERMQLSGEMVDICLHMLGPEPT
jgi:hypothetical protein